MGPNIHETIINELKTFWPPNVGVKQFKEGAGELVTTLDRDFLCLANVRTNLGSYKSKFCFLMNQSTPTQTSPSL